MEQLIKLLERKNLCFKNFYKVCNSFLEEIAQENVDNLGKFQEHRQSLIKVLETLEEDVEKQLKSINVDSKESLNAELDETTKARITQLLQEKDSLVHSILDLDLQILGHIDRIKNDTIQKLQSVQKGRKTVSAYHSPMKKVERAEKSKHFDKKA